MYHDQDHYMCKKGGKLLKAIRTITTFAMNCRYVLDYKYQYIHDLFSADYIIIGQDGVI